VIRDSLAKLVRRTQHRHGCVDIRVVLNRIAATVPTMEEDKDDSNDSQNGGVVYSTITRNERAPGKGIPGFVLVPCGRLSWLLPAFDRTLISHSYLHTYLFPPRERRHACAVRTRSVHLDSESRTVRRRHLVIANVPYA